MLHVTISVEQKKKDKKFFIEIHIKKKRTDSHDVKINLKILVDWI